jgi:SWIM/SEC-C metal-binding protein
MARLGSEKRPIWARVQTMERAEEIASICDARGWKFTAGIEPDQPEDITDLNRLLNPPFKADPSQSISRNAPCPCGSGSKYKKCCLPAG